jgi:hypothetical protein
LRIHVDYEAALRLYLFGALRQVSLLGVVTLHEILEFLDKSSAEVLPLEVPGSQLGHLSRHEKVDLEGID